MEGMPLAISLASEVTMIKHVMYGFEWLPLTFFLFATITTQQRKPLQRLNQFRGEASRVVVPKSGADAPHDLIILHTLGQGRSEQAVYAAQFQSTSG